MGDFLAVTPDNTRTDENDGNPFYPQHWRQNGMGRNGGMDLGNLGNLGNLGSLGSGMGGGLGGLGGMGQMMQQLMQAFMQLLGLGNMNLGAHDQHREMVSQRSSLTQAVDNVQQKTATDPQAKALITEYNKTGEGVRTAIENGRQNQSVTNFMALQAAEMDRSTARAKLVAYDARQRGDTEGVQQADRWRASAGALKEKMTMMAQLPPDQREAAMAKYAQENPHSHITRDWDKFKAGDFRKWDMQEKEDLAAKAPTISTPVRGAGETTPTRTSAAANYETPGSGVRGGDRYDLNGQFTTAVRGPQPTIEPAPGQNGPGFQRQSPSVQTFNV